MPSIDLEPGESHRLTLPGLGSAGYAWDHVLEGATGSVAIAKVLVGETPQAPPGSPPPSSHSRDEQFIITAIEPGEVTVRFLQRRLWEKGKAPLDERELHISVHG